jgi:hypothetical protein
MEETLVLSLRLPKALVAWLDEQAIVECRSRNAQIMYFLRETQRQKDEYHALVSPGYEPAGS